MSLLDLKCSSQPSSLLAAACLANALEVYGKPVWPTVLQHYSAYYIDELYPMRLRLRAVRARSTNPSLSWMHVHFLACSCCAGADIVRATWAVRLGDTVPGACMHGERESRRTTHYWHCCDGAAYVAVVLVTLQVQEGSPAEHIRNLWRLHHEHHSYTEFTQEWATCLLLIACPCPAPQLKGAPSTSTSSGGNSTASAQTAALV